MKYKVGFKEFDTFDDVISWAWNEHKVDAFTDFIGEDFSEEEKHDACIELNTILSAPDEDIEREPGYEDPRYTDVIYDSD